MTFKHYLEQPMPMVERVPIKKVYQNLELIKSSKFPLPKFQEYKDYLDDDEDVNY